jgi:predicted regulator of Ras-like GTPase activity (Roadblock/LC7/MglB family)
VKEIVARLCRVPGVTGAMVISPDGLLIAAETGLGGRAAEETAAAVVANLGRSVGAVLGRLGRGAVKHLVVSGAGGRAVLVAAGPGYLAALLAPDANLGLVQLELGAAAVEAGRDIKL